MVAIHYPQDYLSQEAARILQEESHRSPLPLEQRITEIFGGQREAMHACLIRLQLRLGEVCDVDFGPAAGERTVGQLLEDVSRARIGDDETYVG